MNEMESSYKIGDKVSWDTVSGIKSGVIQSIREKPYGTEYVVSLGEKVVIVHEDSIKEK